MPGTGLKISDVERNKRTIKEFIIGRLADRSRIVTSDFKLFLEAFNIPFYTEQLNVYDLLLPELEAPSTPEKADSNLRRLLHGLAKANLQQWQKVTANAAVVYAALEDRGLYVFEERVYPRWSQHTFSGRTKTSVYNIQGAAATEHIRNPAGKPGDYFLHFDWRAADIRIAALLSGDDRLLNACEHLDPYQYVADFLNVGHEDGLDRDECKLALLKAINSMDTEAHIFNAFPRLRDWISESRQRMGQGHPLASILGRRYVRQEGRKDLSVFNATMQGSIAQAMQLVVHRIWAEFGLSLVAEIHDSIVMTCPRSNAIVKNIIQKITAIMCYPFVSALDANPVFPVRVSIGNSWKAWKELGVYP